MLQQAEARRARANPHALQVRSLGESSVQHEADYSNDQDSEGTEVPVRPLNSDERPIGGAAGRFLPSGRSSYNLDFVDPENEWEDMPLEVDYEEDAYDSEEERERAVISAEYDAFLLETGSQLAVESGGGFPEDGLQGGSSLVDGWTYERLLALDERVEQCGFTGLLPSELIKLPCGVFPRVGRGDVGLSAAGVSHESVEQQQQEGLGTEANEGGGQDIKQGANEEEGQEEGAKENEQEEGEEGTNRAPMENGQGCGEVEGQTRQDLPVGEEIEGQQEQEQVIPPPTPQGGGGGTRSGAELGDGLWRGASECSVCLEKFKSGDECTLLPCDHLFHKACLWPWLRRHRACPYCRAEVFQLV